MISCGMKRPLPCHCYENRHDFLRRETHPHDTGTFILRNTADNSRESGHAAWEIPALAVSASL